MIALDATLTASVRVVDRVHGHTANRGPLTMPASAACLAIGDVLVIEIADLADSGHAIDYEPTHFARGQLHQREIAFLAQQLRRSTGGAYHLSAFARGK